MSCRILNILMPDPSLLATSGCHFCKCVAREPDLAVADTAVHIPCHLYLLEKQNESDGGFLHHLVPPDEGLQSDATRNNTILTTENLMACSLLRTRILGFINLEHCNLIINYDN